MKIEKTILKHLIYSESYTRKVLPFLKPEYFSDRTERIVFEEINKYITAYNNTPSYEALLIELENRKLYEEEYKNVSNLVLDINYTKDELSQEEWLINRTEKFCQDAAIFNAIADAAAIIDGVDKNHDVGVIPDLLSKALAVSFNHNIGHDFLDDAESRFEFYHRKTEKLPFNLEIFNKITKGGLDKKTLTVPLASTGGGKTIHLCDLSAHWLRQGKNVLFISLEMAAEKLSERIDANLMNITIDELYKLTKQQYDDKINKIREKVKGKIIIKEYPTGAANVNHFRSLLNELLLKKNFVPDVIIIDYLNICSSARIKNNGSSSSFALVKSIAEELRGLGIEYNVPVISPAQLNRGGNVSSDPEMDNISESFGINYTADLIYVLISTEELEQINQIMIKQLKNRYNDINYYKRFVVGLNRSKMQFYDVESSAQNDIIDSGKTDDYKSETISKDKFKNVSGFKF